MDDGTGVDLAEPYDAARIAGQKRIQERWQYLTQVTRDTLMASRCYSARGAQIPDAEPASTASEHDAERLEYALGVLALCARASIPARGKVDVGVPREATNSEVLTQCEQLAGVTAWRDPEFLRLGLRALGQHQRAEAFCAVEPSKNSNAALGCVGAILFAGLLLISPCFTSLSMRAF